MPCGTTGTTCSKAVGILLGVSFEGLKLIQSKTKMFRKGCEILKQSVQDVNTVTYGITQW